MKGDQNKRMAKLASQCKGHLEEHEWSEMIMSQKQIR